MSLLAFEKRAKKYAEAEVDSMKRAGRDVCKCTVGFRRESAE